MAYVICDECGGFYELQPGDSPNDFENCECGGSLSFAESLQKNYPSKPKYICSNCLEVNEEGIFCFNCGGKLLEVKNNKSISSINHFDESKKIEKLSKNVIEIPKEPEELVQRINVIGIILGLGFFAIFASASLFIIYILVINNTSNSHIMFVEFFLLSLITIIFLLTISGAIAAYISKSKEYFDGIFNGLAVGFILACLTGLISFHIFSILENVLVFSFFGIIGGVLGIWLRNTLK